MYLFIRALALSLCLWLPAAWAADSGWLKSPQNEHAQVRLIAEPSTNGSVRLLLDVQLAEGWKTYWRSPGEGGVAPTIQWQTPVENLTWGWPIPQRFDVSGISTQGYHGDTVFPLTLQLPTAERHLQGILTLSTCSNVCVLTDFPFDLDLTQSAPQNFDHAFTQAMGSLPLNEGMIDSAQAGYHNGELRISAIRTEGWQKPEIFFDVPEETSFSKPKIQIDGNRLLATVQVTDGWEGSSPDLSGQNLSLVLSDGGLAQQTTLKVSDILPTSISSLGLGSAIIFALLGGLILNLMPCVLPVLAMKLGSVLQLQNRERTVVRRQFLASATGILVSFWALAGLMTALRLSQQAVGWGIQFQNPWFIGLMVLVTAIFSANLFGFFAINLGSNTSTRLATAGGQGHGGHFWQGVFATLLATPCSAPFLGTALAFALAAPLTDLWLVFSALGIGMSLPWLLIAAFPIVARLLPKPGAWMNRLRVVLGLMMLASSLWLISLLVTHIGISIVLSLIGALLLILLVLTGIHYGRKTLFIWGAVLLLTTGAILATGALTADYWRSPMTDNVQWQPLSEQAITQALQENKRVFIDVTADWCVTCKANKYNVLLRDDVQRALNQPDVVALRGDWTRPSPEISQFLQKRGVAAVPFNQIYGPGLPNGEVLSPLLDRQTLLETLSNAKE
ncbi:protein-disulfide reductase DsbD family protein [Pragia fontium]|uniref:Suppressor for copper-sensitivity B n=2 Tax=Pragia fontium TaxID=82985 RepID=A0AAJ4WAG6_9GAMM|nr:protein-disulfide reductase DsbD domain-containing protein [Pragia fontium]GKX62721.1 protein-disulfide reductase [Pragia fontium]SFC76092.1 suppressor for copper-sensitivity B [Pragia fontium DSM 5563 = ATCC 49100]